MERTIGCCEQCGGDLPLIDNDNNHPALPSTRRTGGDCSGRQSNGGWCGAYRAASMKRWESWRAAK